MLTFGGLAGVGDLVATCASPKSRNRTVGFELGQGRSLDEIVDGMQMVAEGVKSAGPLVGLAQAPRRRNADRRAGRGHRRRTLFAAGGAPVADGPPVASRMGRGPARGAGRGERPVRADGVDRPDDGRRGRGGRRRWRTCASSCTCHGATDEEIDQAVADDVLDLFVVDRCWCRRASVHPARGGRAHRGEPSRRWSGSGGPWAFPT